MLLGACSPAPAEVRPSLLRLWGERLLLGGFSGCSSPNVPAVRPGLLVLSRLVNQLWLMLYGLFSANLVSSVAAGYVNSGQRVSLGRVYPSLFVRYGQPQLHFGGIRSPTRLSACWQLWILWIDGRWLSSSKVFWGKALTSIRFRALTWGQVPST